MAGEAKAVVSALSLTMKTSDKLKQLLKQNDDIQQSEEVRILLNTLQYRQEQIRV